MLPLGDETSQVRLVACLDPARNCFGHQLGVLRQRDRGVDEHRIRADLHRERAIRRRTDASIDNNRDLCLLDDDPDLLERLQAPSRADRRASGITVTVPISSSFFASTGSALM